MTIIPNAFQCFNVYVDRAMELLTNPEFRCLVFTARHILGWQDKINTRQGHIGVSVFENGFTDKNGNYYAGTGLGRGAIMDALDSLVLYGFLERVGSPNNPKGQKWRMSEGEINWEGLEIRRQEVIERNREKTKQATKASLEKRGLITSDVLVTSDDTSKNELITSDVTLTRNVARTESKSPQTQKRGAQKTRPEPPARKPRLKDMVSHPLWEAYAEAMNYLTPPVFTNEYKRLALEMEALGYTAEQVTALVTSKVNGGKQRYDFNWLAEDLPPFVQEHQPKPAPSGRWVPDTGEEPEPQQAETLTVEEMAQRRANALGQTVVKDGVTYYPQKELA